MRIKKLKCFSKDCDEVWGSTPPLHHRSLLRVKDSFCGAPTAKKPTCSRACHLVPARRLDYICSTPPVEEVTRVNGTRQNPEVHILSRGEISCFSNAFPCGLTVSEGKCAQQVAVAIVLALEACPCTLEADWRGLQLSNDDRQRW